MIRQPIITTDEWKDYRPIKDFNITQISSNDGKNFPTLHKVIHQVKSWIRGIYSWVSEFNIDRFYIFILKFDRKTFCFIKNRFYKSSSLSRTNVFGLIPLFIIRNYLLSLSPKNEYDTYRICYNK